MTATGLRKDSFEAAVEGYIKREVEKNRRLCPPTVSSQHLTRGRGTARQDRNSFRTLHDRKDSNEGPYTRGLSR